MEAAKTIVIENGSSTIKAGFAGQDEPQAVFSNTISYANTQIYQPLFSISEPTEIIGEDSHSPVFKNLRPIREGIIDSFDHMEKIWHHTFYNKLGQAPEEAIGVVLTEVIRNPRQNREKMVYLMFEEFQVQNLYVALDAVMALFATGRYTGLVCDVGEDFTRSVPVFEGFQIPQAVQKSQIGGRVLTEWMQKLLSSERIDLNSRAELISVKDIKEKFSFVAQDYDSERAATIYSSKDDKKYKMPDGKMITIPAVVRMRCPELLFQPEFNGYCSCKSLHALSYASVQASDYDIKSELCNNIILNGATTMIEGLADRLKEEIIKLPPKGKEIRVITPTDSKNAVWRGASLLASQSTFQASWFTAEDYQEHGANRIHWRCS